MIPVEGYRSVLPVTPLVVDSYGGSEAGGARSCWERCRSMRRRSYTFGAYLCLRCRTLLALGARRAPGLTDPQVMNRSRLMEVPMTRKNESGQALVFAVLALGIVLMGFAGLGIDMGYMRYEKRLQQTAADAAAIAGANDILPGGVTEAAQNAAAANGFTVAAVNVNQCPPPLLPHP